MSIPRNPRKEISVVWFHKSWRDIVRCHLGELSLYLRKHEFLHLSFLVGTVTYCCDAHEPLFSFRRRSAVRSTFQVNDTVSCCETVRVQDYRCVFSVSWTLLNYCNIRLVQCRTVLSGRWRAEPTWEENVLDKQILTCEEPVSCHQGIHVIDKVSDKLYKILLEAEMSPEQFLWLYGQYIHNMYGSPFLPEKIK